MTGGFQILTDAGPAAVAVARLWGPGTDVFLARHVQARARQGPDWTPGAAWRATLLDDSGAALDDILVSVHGASPALDVRLHLHGSPAVVRQVCRWAEAAGLAPRGAPPLWPTVNRVQAEAWKLLPCMTTPAGAHWLGRQPETLAAAVRALLAQPDDCLVASTHQALPRWIDAAQVLDAFLTPMRVALVGPPNAGKSTLVNALVGQAAALVSPVPGTTRDWLEVRGECRGFPMVWLDTAGIRQAADALEAESIRRTRRVMDGAGAVVFVLDATADGASARHAFTAEYRDRCPALVVLNKSDAATALPAVRCEIGAAWNTRQVEVSAERRTGLDALADALLAALGRAQWNLGAPALVTERQRACASEALASRSAADVRRTLGALLGAQQAESAPALPPRRA